MTCTHCRALDESLRELPHLYREARSADLGTRRDTQLSDAELESYHLDEDAAEHERKRRADRRDYQLRKTPGVPRRAREGRGRTREWGIRSASFRNTEPAILLVDNDPVPLEEVVGYALLAWAQITRGVLPWRKLGPSEPADLDTRALVDSVPPALRELHGDAMPGITYELADYAAEIAGRAYRECPGQRSTHGEYFQRAADWAHVTRGGLRALLGYPVALSARELCEASGCSRNTPRNNAQRYGWRNVWREHRPVYLIAEAGRTLPIPTGYGMTLADAGNGEAESTALLREYLIAAQREYEAEGVSPEDARAYALAVSPEDHSDHLDYVRRTMRGGDAETRADARTPF